MIHVAWGVRLNRVGKHRAVCIKCCKGEYCKDLTVIKCLGSWEKEFLIRESAPSLGSWIRLDRDKDSGELRIACRTCELHYNEPTYLNRLDRSQCGRHGNSQKYLNALNAISGVDPAAVTTPPFHRTEIRSVRSVSFSHQPVQSL